MMHLFVKIFIAVNAVLLIDVAILAFIVWLCIEEDGQPIQPHSGAPGHD